MINTLDIPTVQAFLLVAELQSFTRAAEALGTTQAAVSMKLQRLESVVGKRLVERSPRAVRLTAEGATFLDNARALMQAHDRALCGEQSVRLVTGAALASHPGLDKIAFTGSTEVGKAIARGRAFLPFVGRFFFCRPGFGFAVASPFVLGLGGRDVVLFFVSTAIAVSSGTWRRGPTP